MNKDNELYRIVWTQVYDLPVWQAKQTPETEEVLDLTQAQEVLARIMSK